MDRRMPVGNPVEGLGWLRLPSPAALPPRRPGVVPRSGSFFSADWWLYTVRALVVILALGSLAAPPAMARDRLIHLTTGPEPSNLVMMALALAVLFAFRRFSRTS